MTFVLEVEFSGLCQYLVHRDGTQVGIILPDARLGKDGLPVNADDYCTTRKHLVNHVGYLRYDLADTGVPIPMRGRAGTPSFEVVYRFDGDDLDFGLGSDQPLEQCDLYVPDVGEFAPLVTLKPGMFSSQPPERLLMRTVLRGGHITSKPNGGLWKFNDVLQPKSKPYARSFSGLCRWRRMVFSDELVLRLRSWDGREKMTISLAPRGQDKIVRLKIANLCSNNPMEWPELFPRMFEGEADDDFKWFYFLWQDSRGSFKDLISERPPHTLPVPEPVPGHGDVSNCTPPKLRVNSLGEAI